MYFKRREALREYLFKTFLRHNLDSSSAKTSADAVFALEARIACCFRSAVVTAPATTTESSRIGGAPQGYLSEPCARASSTVRTVHRHSRSRPAEQPQ